VTATLAQAVADGVVVLDGGLATTLEAAGHDVSGRLWSARLLRDDPAAIVAAHAAFLAAGAQVATTASYQATYAGLAAAGIDAAETTRLLRRSVALAREAQQASARPAWVAASIGPYGAMLADGSEYRGDYGLSVRQLREFHRPRLEVLAEAGPDVLALETVPCLAEAEALVAEVTRLGVPAWLSLTVTGDRTRNGEPAREAFALAADAPAVVAVGVNCCDPRDVPAAVRAAHAASGKPVVAYPNSGEDWDATGRRWTGSSSLTPDAVTGWVRGEARLVGGCCRVGPEQIRSVADAVAGGA
jgi:homocysteine S-methyltransferase